MRQRARRARDNRLLRVGRADWRQRGRLRAGNHVGAGLHVGHVPRRLHCYGFCRLGVCDVALGLNGRRWRLNKRS